MVDFFTYPTIAALAGFLGQSETRECDEGEQRGERRRARQLVRKKGKRP